MRGTGVEDDRGGGVVAYPNSQTTITKEVQGPIAEGGAEAQAMEFGDGFHGNNGVEGSAVVNK